jgi:arsenite methyltransferase
MKTDQEIHEAVQKRYAAIATQATSGCCSCCDADSNRLVEYQEGEFQVVAGSDLGLGCGLPTRYANFKPGETVLDLGSGAGVDVFLAARQVGPAGFALGVDMTPEMIQLASLNAERAGYQNVEFRLGNIAELPVESGTIDIALSNCVINLAPDKPKVFSELYRVLKPGGRFVIADTVTFGPLPEPVRNDLTLWAGCISGALDLEDYLSLIREAGFISIETLAYEVYDYLKADNYGMASLTVGAVKP